MSGLLSDLRSAWRVMGRHRSTSILILTTLTLGLGANVAIFAIARGVVLRPLPYDDPDRLVMIWAGSEPRRPGDANRGVFSPGWFHELTARQRSFLSIAALESWDGRFRFADCAGGRTAARRLHHDEFLHHDWRLGRRGSNLRA